MTSFEEKLNEDIRSTLKAYGGAYAKYFRDSFLATLGSAKAQGRLSLSMLVGQLARNYNYFLGHQKMEPTIQSMVAYIQSIFPKAKFSEKELAKISPSRPNFNVGAPNADEIKIEFEDLIDHRNLDQEEFDATIANISNFAKRDKRDATLVGEYMKYLRLQHPDVLEIPEVNELAEQFGERLNNDQAKMIFTKIAQIILRNEQTKDEQSLSSDNLVTDSETDKESTDGDVREDGVSYIGTIAITPKPKHQSERFEGLPEPKERGEIMTEEKAETALHQLGFGLQEIEELWGESKSISDFQTEVKNRLKYPVINAMSAHLFPYIAQHLSAADFGSLFLQNSEGAAMLNRIWPNSYRTYKYAYMGGDPDEITAELNHFLNDSIHASIFFTLCVKAYAVLKNRERNNNDGDE